MKLKNHSNRVAKKLKPFFLFSALLLCFAVALSASAELLEGLLPRAAAARQKRGDQNQPQIGALALRQIQSLVAEKRNRTPQQRKIDSQLLFAAKMRRGQALTPDAPSIKVNVEIDEENQTIIDITADVSSKLIKRIEEMGGHVIKAVPEYRSLRARVSIDLIEAIAALPEVQFIQPKQQASTSRSLSHENGTPNRSTMTSSFPERAAHVREYLAKTLPRLSNKIGAAQELIAEGDITHRANEARQMFGINGSGIKIGVLSDGATHLKLSQAKGALGPVTVLPRQLGDGDEGTAMLEIIHAIAPGAQLFFATAFNGIAGFAQNIRELQRVGCDIIVDDVFYVAESAFQDGQDLYILSQTNGGLITQAVNDVVANGVLYFSSIGNGGNLVNHNSGVWEGDFKDGGKPFGSLPSDAGRIHDFGGGKLTNQITGSSRLAVILEWSDPLGKSTNDYDLYVLDSTGTFLIEASTNAQDGSQDPFESVGPQDLGRQLVIAKFSGEDRFLHLNTMRGRLAIGTDGEAHGHPAAAGALGVAATPAASAFGFPPNPMGPFPNSFSSINKAQLFNSDGPRRVFFRPDGTPYTPGNFLSTGGLLRQKPDITAADGVSVTGAGFFSTPFFGTSAAAPHAAAIAALIKSANRSFTNAQIRNALINSAIDIEAPGVDSTSGAGIIMPINSAQALGIEPMANLALGDIIVTEVGGNGNGRIDPGEKGRLIIELKNLGVVNATNVTARLSSLIPGVVISSFATASYSDLTAGTGTATNNTPFEFSLSTISACNLTAAFTLTVSYAGGPSPKALNFEVNTGSPPIIINSTLDTAEPPSGTNFTAVTGTQNGRLARTLVPSTCNAKSDFPGVFSPVERRYDAYAFSSCPTSATTCVTVTLSSPCSQTGGLFAVAYLDDFDPNNLAGNYLGDSGDAGLSPGEELSFSFNLPRGRKFIIVVHELNPNGSTGCDYTLTVSGLCDSCTTSNMVCVQDDQTSDYLLWNLLTGDYLFTRCADNSKLVGRGIVGRGSGATTFRDGARVSAEVITRITNRGTAIVRPNPLGSTFRIKDHDILNSSCSCP